MGSEGTGSGSGNSAMAPSEGVKAAHMQAAILALGAVTLPLLLFTFGFGYSVHYGWFGATAATHVKLGLLTTILTMLTHTTTMFYFMGTGSAIKSEVKDRGLDVALLRRARAFKGGFFYALFFGMLLIMATAMLGGGAHSDMFLAVQTAGQSLFSRIHELLAITSLLINVTALVMTPMNIARNNQLLDDVFGSEESGAATGNTENAGSAEGDGVEAEKR